MILITGGTGTVGSELVKQLSNTGAKLRLLARDPKKVFKHPNVEVVIGDLGNAAQLTRALTGVEKLFLLTHSFPGSVELHNNVIDEAEKVGVRHVIRLSLIGAEAQSPISLARWHAASDAHLQTTSVKWTVVRSSFFMQNFLGSAGTIKRDATFYSAARDGKTPFIDARDLAAAAVKILTTHGHEGQIYNLTGTQALSFNEVAARFGTLLRKPVRHVDLPPEQFLAGLLGAGIPEWRAKDFVLMHLAFAAGKAAAIDPTLARLITSPHSFDDFLAAYGSFFR